MKRGAVAGRAAALGLAAVAIVCLVWIGLHVRWESGEKAFSLTSSQAALRTGERMPKALPQALPQGQVAVNTATVDELCALSGVGPALAQVIVAEREANGAFYFPEDLLCVKGIGQKKLSGFVEQIKLDE